LKVISAGCRIVDSLGYPCQPARLKRSDLLQGTVDLIILKSSPATHCVAGRFSGMVDALPEPSPNEAAPLPYLAFLEM
jgi:hypothetical protein